MLFSASQLKTAMSCMLQWKFRYKDRLPSEQSAAASYGTIIHYVTEQMDRGASLEEAEKLFIMLWHEPERLGVKPDYYPYRTSFDSYKRKGLLTVKGYQEFTSWGKPQIIASEFPFRVPIGNHEVRGIIDRIELRKTGKREVLSITDFKSSAKRPTKFDLRTDIQFSCYLYASLQEQFWTGIPGDPDYPGFQNGAKLHKQFADHDRAGIYLMLGESCTELDVGERGDLDFRQLYRLMDELEHAIDQEVFVPKIGASTCGNCDYFDVCGIDIPKPPLDTNIDERPRVV